MSAVRRIAPALGFLYNNGTSNVWQIRERDGTWTFTGDWNVEGEALNVRCTTGFSDAGKTMTAKWEYSRDGSTWQVFWDTKLTRA
jgi:hypothetical protein